MKKQKEFEINGCVSAPGNLSYDDFWDKFIEFIETNNWSFGGGINEIIDGFYIDGDGKIGGHVLDQDLKELTDERNSFRKLTNFLNKLDENKIYYKLDTIRNDYIMVEVAVPGQRWEAEFSPDGDVVVERFKSFEDVGDEELLEYLFENFSD